MEIGEGIELRVSQPQWISVYWRFSNIWEFSHLKYWVQTSDVHIKKNHNRYWNIFYLMYPLTLNIDIYNIN